MVTDFLLSKAVEVKDQKALKRVKYAEQIVEDDLCARDGQSSEHPRESQQQQDGDGCARALV